MMIRRIFFLLIFSSLFFLYKTAFGGYISTEMIIIFNHNIFSLFCFILHVFVVEDKLCEKCVLFIVNEKKNKNLSYDRYVHLTNNHFSHRVGVTNVFLFSFISNLKKRKNDEEYPSHQFGTKNDTKLIVHQRNHFYEQLKRK